MKTPSPKIKIISGDHAGFRKKVVLKLSAFNESKVGPVGWKEIGFEARDGKGRFIGGLTGSTYLGWLYVDLLFVEEKYRGQGVGTHLLKTAETWAKKRGCHHVNLNTITFQAPGFYRKLGYKVFGRLSYPKGNIRYFLKKKL